MSEQDLDDAGIDDVEAADVISDFRQVCFAVKRVLLSQCGVNMHVGEERVWDGT